MASTLRPCRLDTAHPCGSRIRHENETGSFATPVRQTRTPWSADRRSPRTLRPVRFSNSMSNSGPKMMVSGGSQGDSGAVPGCGSGGLDGVEPDGVAEGVGLSDDAAHGAFGVEPCE